jgi:hypothetical protein
VIFSTVVTSEQVSRVNYTLSDNRLVYGTAVYEDGASAEDATVYVKRSGDNNWLGPETVHDNGYWQVNCSWPPGVPVTVIVKGCCGHNGWRGEAELDLEAGDTNAGHIIIYEDDGNSKYLYRLPIFLQFILTIFQNRISLR